MVPVAAKHSPNRELRTKNDFAKALNAERNSCENLPVLKIFSPHTGEQGSMR